MKKIRNIEDSERTVGFTKYELMRRRDTKVCGGLMARVYRGYGSGVWQRVNVYTEYIPI